MKYLLAILAFVSTSAFAQWSVQVHGLSKHSGTKQFNEVNPGLSIRYDVSKDVSYQAGTYLNSFNKQSVFAGVNYTPYHFGRVSFGGAAGFGTGYGLPILATVVANVDFGRVNVTFRGAPKYSPESEHVVAVEVGFRY